MATKKKKVLQTQKASLFQFMKPSTLNPLAKAALKQKIPAITTTLPRSSSKKSSSRKRSTKKSRARKSSIRAAPKKSIVKKGISKAKEFLRIQPGVGERAQDILTKTGILPDPEATEEERLRDAALGMVPGGTIAGKAGKAALRAGEKAIVSRFGTRAETIAGEAVLKRGRDFTASTTEQLAREAVADRIRKESVTKVLSSLESLVVAAKAGASLPKDVASAAAGRLASKLGIKAVPLKVGQVAVNTFTHKKKMSYLAKLAAVARSPKVVAGVLIGMASGVVGMGSFSILMTANERGDIAASLQFAITNALKAGDLEEAEFLHNILQDAATAAEQATLIDKLNYPKAAADKLRNALIIADSQLRTAAKAEQVEEAETLKFREREEERRERDLEAETAKTERFKEEEGARRERGLETETAAAERFKASQEESAAIRLEAELAASARFKANQAEAAALKLEAALKESKRFRKIEEDRKKAREAEKKSQLTFGLLK